MRRRLHFKVETKENILERKRGFTLIELLAVIVIIGVIGGIAATAIISIINNSKESATLLAINNVKSAAELYSKENSGEIKWINQYKEDGTETGKFVCMTVRQLINNGYFDDKFFEEDIYHERINDNTFIEIKQGVNSDNTNVIIHEDATTQNDCEMSAINTALSEIELTDSDTFTDQINFSVKPKEDVGEVEFSASYENDKQENIPGNCTNGSCTFDSLKNNTGYKIKVCMSPDGTNTNFTSTVCEFFGLSTSEFEYPDITISNSKKWKQSKTVTITYSDENIRDGNGVHYFKSEVKATIDSGNIFECKNNNECNTNSTQINPNTWYKVSGEKVKFLVEEHIGKGNSKLVTTRIQDQTGNYVDKKANITRIDRELPDCISSGGNGNNWTNNKVTLTGTCSDEDSGCKGSTKIIEKIVNETKEGMVSPGIVWDEAGNTRLCPGEKVSIDMEPPTCDVTGGNTSWINASSNPGYRRITATCSDTGGSGCKVESFYKDYSSNINTKKAGAVNEDEGGYVEDIAGNKTNCKANQTVKIDKQAPKCSVSGGNANWINANSNPKSVTITATCSDTGGSECSVESFSKEYKTDLNVSNAGAVDVGNGGTVKDNAGNVATCEANQTVKIDITPPKCSSSGGNTSWTNKTVTIYGKCSDAGSLCIQNQISKNINYNQNGGVSPGKVKDNAGNSSTCSNVNVYVDVTPPTIIINAGADNYQLSVTRSDNLSGIKSASWSGGVNSNGTSNGTGNTATYTAYDNAGNKATVSHSTYKWCNSTVSKGDVKVYKWGNLSEQSCDGSNKYRKYNFRVGDCSCSVDKYKTNRYCGSSSFNENTKNSHPDTWNGSHSTATIHYKNNDNGKKACNGNKPLNSYVNTVCTNSGQISEAGKFYHGYMWYNKAANSSYQSFSANSFYHNVQSNGVTKFNSNISNFNQACNAACSYKYNG